MNQFTIYPKQNYAKFLASGLELMRMNRIYACIPGLQDIPGQWTGDEPDIG